MRAARFLFLAGWLFVFGPGAGEELRHIVVSGDAAWTDTGIDVVAGQDVRFDAEGSISLQKGNPQAECGPEGTDLRTVQQPLQEQNLGSLIGKVVAAVTVIKDERTGEERTEEVFELFFIGARNRLEMPTNGRLFLGINELVVGDNAGAFTVAVVTGPESKAPYF
ncbi:MAG: hypothetical protein JXE07_06220 [Candidatus Aminicenantes bacterium]|nr:hypothetical protein [Candidatus Aminicenantes bacterium]